MADIAADAVLVRDRSTQNPHLARVEPAEDNSLLALCNKRYKVWDYGTLEHDRTSGENIWSWAACPRCVAKVAKGETYGRR